MQQYKKRGVSDDAYRERHSGKEHGVRNGVRFIGIQGDRAEGTLGVSCNGPSSSEPVPKL